MVRCLYCGELKRMRKTASKCKQCRDAEQFKNGYSLKTYKYIYEQKKKPTDVTVQKEADCVC
jgi:hypothetical protein